MTGKLCNHPISELFPMMSEHQQEQLKADIQEHGLQCFGLMFEGKILDGRNRYRACQELGLDMTWEEVELGDDVDSFDPVSYVLTHNLHRRHLTTGQRSMVAAKLATLKNGQHGKAVQFCTASDDAALLLNVSRRSVCTAKQVIEHGADAVVEAVEQCKLPVSLAAKFVIAQPDKKQQAKLVKQGREAVKEFVDGETNGSVARSVPAEKPESFAAIRSYFDASSAEDRIAVLAFVETCKSEGVAGDKLTMLHSLWIDWCS